MNWGFPPPRIAPSVTPSEPKTSICSPGWLSSRRPQADYEGRTVSKYEPLRTYLAQQSGEVILRMADMDALIPGGLAPSARKDNRWWWNDDPSHAHCRSWGDAGFTAHP